VAGRCRTKNDDPHSVEFARRQVALTLSPLRGVPIPVIQLSFAIFAILFPKNAIC
jgi:hypothetical protein